LSSLAFGELHSPSLLTAEQAQLMALSANEECSDHALASVQQYEVVGEHENLDIFFIFIHFCDSHHVQQKRPHKQQYPKKHRQSSQLRN